MDTYANKPLIFLICPGLGRINRGYESFTQECFDSLKNTRTFCLQLIKGGGRHSVNETVLPNFSRNSAMAKWLAKMLHKNAYYIEQLSFLLALVPLILLKKPALIIYSDYMIGSYLWHIRKRLKFSYKLLFVNGAPNGPPYKTEDHVQQLLPVYYSIGVKCDGREKHTCLPYAFNIDLAERKNSIQQKTAIRDKMGFKPGQKVILSVGAINMRHKRMDYLINEVAQLDETFILVMLGQFDEETNAVRELAHTKLPGRHFIANLPKSELSNYYVAVDYFVLASLREGFPRVTIEALSYGLPCLVNDYIVMRQVLKESGIYIDMRFDGELARSLAQINKDGFSTQKLMQQAYDQYSWHLLAPGYVNMIENML